MNKLHRGLLVAIFVFIAFVMQSPKTYAKDTMLNKIVVAQNNGNYDISVYTDKKINYSKKIISPNKMILKFKGSAVSDETKTLYSNVSEIEHVMINPGEHNVSIEISAPNIIKSNINFNTEVKQVKNNSGSLYYAAVILFSIIGFVCFKKRKKNSCSIKIPVIDEENKILKVAFESKEGLIVQGTGARRKLSHHNQTRNVRKVCFTNGNELRELITK